MRKIILFGYSKCSTCRKASRWLDQKGFKYQLKDIVNDPPSYEYLDLALKQYSSNKLKVFNTRGKSFKLIDIDLNSLSDDRVIHLLLNDGKLIKRPFLVDREKEIILGFNENFYTNHFS